MWASHAHLSTLLVLPNRQAPGMPVWPNHLEDHQSPQGEILQSRLRYQPAEVSLLLLSSPMLPKCGACTSTTFSFSRTARLLLVELSASSLWTLSHFKDLDRGRFHHKVTRGPQPLTAAVAAVPLWDAAAATPAPAPACCDGCGPLLGRSCSCHGPPPQR